VNSMTWLAKTRSIIYLPSCVCEARGSSYVGPCLNCDVVTLTSVKSVDLQKDRMDSLHHWHTCVYFCVKTLFAGALPQSSSLPADAAEERGGGYDSRDGLVRLHAELAV